MTQYVFVTGGVVSSLGKGIVVASIGRMLKSRGVSVGVMKLDPYLNVDPGTMSPYQHGEVYVTGDGSETDLDLGHYERFIDVELTAASNVTAGQIYSDVISRERNGRYLGGTIQTVPHVTNLIKERIHQLADETGADVVVVEVGGTVGDIEGLPFLEAIRQIRNDVGRDNASYVHLTLLPYLGSTHELKTKPTQHSVQALRGIGIQPDAIICRSDHEVNVGLREKISLYCDVPVEAVIGLETLDSVYAVPLRLEEQGFGDFLAERLGITNSPDLSAWSDMVDKLRDPKRSVRIAIVGKYVELPDAYLSVIEALRHAALAHDCEVKIDWIKAEDIEEEGADHLLNRASGIVVPGGFGERGIEGMIAAAHYARERGVPYLGLCLGMQVMVIEYARFVLGLEDANSSEFDPGSENQVIAYLPGQRELGATGGTMRLGLYPCALKPGSIAARAYDRDLVNERHRHRYELNNDYRDRLEKAGLISSGTAPDGSLVEISEVKDHLFMLGTQFHPEFASRPDRPHPLFREFVGAAVDTLREGAQHTMPLEDSAADDASSPSDVVARLGISR
ncbi:MAG: CTP synthase [Chloroflexi bacterium]|nr:CTP synthase [Chloroflexota bacterium]MCH8816946.1 CTP synthase [Chloroflexota bacterium]